MVVNYIKTLRDLKNLINKYIDGNVEYLIPASTLFVALLLCVALFFTIY